MYSTANKQKITYTIKQRMESGDYNIVLGEHLDNNHRYKILSFIGQGTFCKCVECWDRKTKKTCAVKIIKNIMQYNNDSLVEHKILKKL